METVDIPSIRKRKYNKPTGRPVDLRVSAIVRRRRKRHAARHQLHYYVSTNRVKRLPCEYADCPNIESEGHHPDYNFPLIVVWLCKAHHQELHKHFGIL